MTEAGELARRLVDYDRDLAETVLEALREKLGDRDVVASEFGDPRAATAPREEGRSPYEAARALASELAALLRR